MNIKLTLYCIIIAQLCFACGDDDVSMLQLGEDFVDSESGIVLIDTLSIKLSNVHIDSIQTSNTGVALVGAYNSDETGKIQADAIFRLGLCSEIITDEDVLDSITICVKHNQYYRGDTSQILSFKIHELETDLDDLDESIFYNTTTFSVADEVIGEVSYYPSPNSGDEYEFKLSNAFSTRLFNLFLEDADEIGDATSFVEYLKGIVFKSDENDAIVGFLANEEDLKLKMYYHRVEHEKLEFTATFPIEVSNNQFNHIQSDRSTSLLKDLNTQREDIGSLQTNNTVFLEGGTGVMTKVMFPGLAHVFQLVLLNQIIKAELILEPTKQSIEANDYNLPLSLSAYTTNSTNAATGFLVGSDGITELSFSLVKTPHDYEESYYYSIDITQYIINELLNGYFDPDFALLVSLNGSDQASTVKNLAIGGDENTDFTPKFKLYTYYY